ncbi:MAG TPA: hypothetical protein VEJ19_00600 [Nitrososphaerales archaeon]|nr:hypothetical protein [Nitrososphaerales archaeon]
MSREDEEEPEGEVSLEWKDYVAFVIAAFETILVPLVIFVIVLLLMLALIR